MELGDLRAIMNGNTIIILNDRCSEQGVVYEGQERYLSSEWDWCNVEWLRPDGEQQLYIIIASSDEEGE